MTAAPVNRSRVPAPGPLRPFHFPDIQRITLADGLPLLFARSGGFDVVTLGLVIRAGGVQEDPARAGLATLTSALLDAGAGRRSGSQIAADLEQLGIQLDVGSSWDATQIELTGLASRIPPATEILAELAREPTFPSPEVERLRQEQIAAMLQRRAEPRGAANEVAARALFAPGAAFARPLAGTPESVQALTRSDVLEFHRRCYTPQASCVVVTGDLELDQAEALAARAFAGWSGAASPEAAEASTPRAGAREVWVVDRPGAVQTEIRVGQVGVAHDTPDYFPLVVMNSILGGAFSSRLNMNLRERHGFTYGVSSGFAMRRQPGPFVISTAVQTEVTGAALKEIFRELEAIRAAPVAPAELEDARSYLAGVFPLALQTTDGIASRLAELFVYDLPSDYFERYRERIMAVDADQVLRAAREHLNPDGMAVVVAGDAAAIRGPLEELGLGAVRMVGVEGTE